MRLILLGAPGSGKGTQAEMIREKYSVAHISTGDILRSNIAEGTELGKRAREFTDSGRLVPDGLVIEMVEHRLRESDTRNGFLLDGFPRTLPQAEALEMFLKLEGKPLDAVLLLEVPDETVVGRLTNRRTCRKCGKIHSLAMLDEGAERCPVCGGELYQREDDKEEVIRKRLATYHEQTAPLISWYESKGLLRRFDGSRSPEETFDAIRSKLPQ